MIVVAVYNMKGGVGKSTTAVNLAYGAASSGARTLLWDLDPQAASSFAFRVHPEVEGFGKKSLRLVDTLTEAIKATDYDNLDLLPADFAYRKLDRFLDQSGRPNRDLAEVIRKLGRKYTFVLLDCPPGLSILSENVFAAADLILVPTIPTVLSLRTLSRLVEHVGHRGNGAKLTAFLSMVDRRKALHRQISEWAVHYPEFFLPTQVPYASAIEQMSVRRMPLAAVAPQDAAATAFDTLWSNVQARLAKPALVPGSEQQQSAAFVKATADLITRPDGVTDSDAVPVVSNDKLLCTASEVRAANLDPDTHRFRLKVHGEDAFESLGLGPSPDPQPGATRIVHIFDTEDGVLLRDGYLLQLLEAPGTFAVVLERQSSCCEPASRHDDVQAATIDRRWAADVLAECLSPVSVLERRFKRPLPKLISEVVTAAGKQPLRRVTSLKHLIRHVGPVLVPYDNATVTLHFDFDRISRPESKVDYEIEATATGSDAHHCERALRQVFSHAGINWEPLTLPSR